MKHGVMFDVGCMQERPETIASQIRRLAAAGYSIFLINLEDGFDFPSAPGIGRKYAWTSEQLRLISQAAQECKVELVPIIPSMGHALYITEKEAYASYDEGYDSGECLGTLQVGEEMTYELLERLYADWCAVAPGKYLHIGMDECPAIGQHLLRSGQVKSLDEGRLFAEHCNRLCRMAEKFGRQLIIWGDMFYYFPQAIDLLDRSIIVMDWYYYDMRCGTPRVEVFNFEPVDLTTKLRQAGFTVWGTPSVWPNLPFGNVSERLENLRDWVRYGQERGADEYTVNTDWYNALGEAAFAEMLWLTFIRLAPDFREDGLSDAFAVTLRDDYGIADSAPLVKLLMAAGDFHLTGTRDNMREALPCAAELVTSSAVRRQAAADKARRLQELLPPLENLVASRQEGRELLEAIRAAYGIVLCYWHSIDTLSRMALEGASASEVRQLAAMLQKAQQRFLASHDQMRVQGDLASNIQFWAGRLATELLGEAKRLENGKPFLSSQVLVELRLHVPNPSWSGVRISAPMASGRIRTVKRALIGFECRFARPDGEASYYVTLRLPGDELPDWVKCEAYSYGQVEIQEVRAWNTAGKSKHYALAELDGRNAVRQGNGMPLLGPLRMNPGEPTDRSDTDTALFR